MKADILTIRSSIKSEVYRKFLFRGAFYSLLGFIPLIYGSLWIDADTLSTWGIPIFMISIGCIMYGMLPFKRLSELQKHPHTLHLVDGKSIGYDYSGRKTLTIPFSAIEGLSYFEGPAMYGIRLHLKKFPKEKVAVHNPKFAYQRFEKASRKKYGCDLFFPYFSERGFKRLQWGGVPNSGDS